MSSYTPLAQRGGALVTELRGLTRDQREPLALFAREHRHLEPGDPIHIALLPCVARPRLCAFTTILIAIPPRRWASGDPCHRAT
jgi:hypothetical protein